MPEHARIERSMILLAKKEKPFRESRERDGR